MLLRQGDKVGIVGCSNALSMSNKTNIDELLRIVERFRLIPICSDFLYEKYSVFSGDALDRGKALMDFYLDPQIKAIFDISGGDIANEILPYLDFQVIKKHYKPFFGYSDLTTIINSLYSQTGYHSYLYQLRNLVYDEREEQQERFVHSLFHNSNELYDINYTFLQGEGMKGIVVGGNIRCFLKLAGTPYMPDFRNKILFLESLGGDVGLMTTYLNQYKQMGVFQKINGILLGTFTKMEKEKLRPTIEELVINIVGDVKLPIGKTEEIGQGVNSKCLVIGKQYIF
ncbi:MAG: LD-carboxypeptidase [Anaerocolumna aminovalerica]|uniref:S66 family peptidase n=1 Tax=Anaerocolumna aminovalerica TaxID=1527 RepID=UPI002914DE0D|nr:LD-carboxypeptidase [Anaerocolumna aminovalerica]MDU6266558.1 LD-carboxypeptidase [Anaerocolumna aminovalerica]